MKQKVCINQVKGSEFTATLYDPKLSKFQIEALGIIPENGGELQVVGDFHVQWDGEIALAYVDAILAYSEVLGKWIALDEYQLDYDDAANQLESDYTNQAAWHSDREAARLDRAYESYRDEYF